MRWVITVFGTPVSKSGVMHCSSDVGRHVYTYLVIKSAYISTTYVIFLHPFLHQYAQSRAGTCNIIFCYLYALLSIYRYEFVYPLSIHHVTTTKLLQY